VPYYFQTKEKLPPAALDLLAERKRELISIRVNAARQPDNPRTVIEAVLIEALPTDQDSRTFHLVYTAYAVLTAADARCPSNPSSKLQPDGALPHRPTPARPAQLATAAICYHRPARPRTSADLT
jgi:hypothetical protein